MCRGFCTWMKGWMLVRVLAVEDGIRFLLHGEKKSVDCLSGV